MINLLYPGSIYHFHSNCNCMSKSLMETSCHQHLGILHYTIIIQMPAITHPFCWWNKRFYFIVFLRQFPASLRQNTIYNQELEIGFRQDILYSIIFPIMNMLQIHGYYRLVPVLLREKFSHHWKMVI